MRLRIAVFATLLVLFIGTGVAYGVSTVDIGVPSSYPLSVYAQAVTDNGSTVTVVGSIGIVHSGGNIYLTIPTTAPDNVSLYSIDDHANGILYRNHTMYLPIRYTGQWAANLVVATDNMTSSGGKFTGQVTGLELDTADLSTGDRSNASASATLYLNNMPEAATYHIAIVQNDTVSRAVQAAGAQGQEIGLMVEVTGFRSGDTASIGNMIMRMKIDGSDPNVAIYRYTSGAEKLDTHAVMGDNGSIVAEAMSGGPGIYTLTGRDFKSQYPPGPGLLDILIFAIIIIVLIAALALVVKSLMKKQKGQKIKK